MNPQSSENEDREDMKESTKCQICLAPSSKICAACSSVFYCSAEHQLQDWKIHKKNCKAYALRQNDEVGRHYVATRNLSAGTLILKERPTVSGPGESPPELGKVFAAKTRCCAGCNRILLIPMAKKCTKCKLPVCSSACEKLAIHASNECEIFQKLSVKPSNFDYKDLLTLRTCLLKNKNSAAWESIMNLQYSVAKTGDLIEMNATNKSKVEDMFGNIFRVVKTITPEEWIRVMNILHTNSTQMAKSFRLPNGIQYTGSWQYLSLDATMFAHSCVPNCQFDSSPMPLQTLIRTTTAVKKGEILTVNYNAKNWLLGTYKRQRLNDRFVCACIRCKDPTEMGSNLSTFVCGQCKASEMMPTNPSVETADWLCRKCGHVESGLGKIELMDKISKEIDEINLQEKGKSQLMALIGKYGACMHANNFVLVKAHFKLKEYLEVLSDSMGLIAFSQGENCSLYISIIEYLKEIANLIAPGSNLQRAQLCYHLGIILSRAYAYRHAELKINIIELRKVLDRVNENYMEAYKFFKTYINSLDGSKCKTAFEIENELEEVKRLYKGPPLGYLMRDDDFMLLYGEGVGFTTPERTGPDGTSGPVI